jgi:outer membrane lipoprotein LolB
MTRRGLLRALAGVPALLLAACATLSPVSGGSDNEQARNRWENRRTTLQQVQNFSLQGRLAESGLVSFGGELSWIQTGDHFEARFSGPLGVGAVAISGEPDTMQVRTRDGTYLTGEPEVLMQDQFGWSLPVNGLRYWVLGLPAPGAEPALQLDSAGRVLSMNQDGWQLDYTDYHEVAGLDLPHKFTLSDPQRRFRIVIDAWSDVR